MKSKHLLKVMGPVAIAAILLSACAGATPTPQIVEVEVTKIVAGTPVVEVQVVTATPEPTPAEKPKLTVWYSLSYIDAWDATIIAQMKDYAKANNIDLTVDSFVDVDLEPKWAAALEAPETLPDVTVLFQFWLGKFYNAGQLVDVSENYAHASEQGGGFWANFKDVVTIDGKQWAMPYLSYTQPMYVRKDILAAAGVQVPKTYEEMLEVCRKVKKPGLVCYGQGLAGLGDNEWQARNELWSFGGRILTEDGVPALDSLETRAWLTWFKTMWDEGHFSPDMANWGGADNNTCYLSGNCVFIVNGGAVLQALKTSDPQLAENTEMALAPGGPGGQYGTFGLDLLVVTKNTKYPELATGLVEYLADPDREWVRVVGSGYGWQPLFQDNAKQDALKDPYFKPFIDMMPLSRSAGWGTSAYTADLDILQEKVLSGMLTRIVVDSYTVDQAIAEAITKINEILARQ